MELRPLLDPAEKDMYLAGTLEAFPYAAALYTPDGTLVWANDAFFRDFYVADRNSVLGRLNLFEDTSTVSLGQTERIRMVLQGVPAVVEDIKIPVRDIVLSRGDTPPEGIFYKSIIAFPIRDKGGAVVYMATFFIPTREYRGRDEFVRGKEYIEDHWKDSFDLSAVARYAGLSRDQFSKVFRELAGMTPYDFYMQVRIRHLKEKLLDLNLSVSQVFADCGMEYNGYYAGLFKRHTGVTPTQVPKKQPLNDICLRQASENSPGPAFLRADLLKIILLLLLFMPLIL